MSSFHIKGRDLVMLNPILINVFITLAVVGVYYHIYRLKGEYFYRHPYASRMAFGLINGLIGFHLMINSIAVSPGIIVDSRNLMVIISAIGGGPLSAVITAMVIGSMRIIHWGLSTNSIIALVSILFLTLGTSYACYKFKSFRSKWIACYIWNVFTGFIFITYVLHKAPNYFAIITVFILANTVLSYYLFHLINYYIDFHNNYSRISKETTMDFLTGLNNVRGFDIEFNKAINRSSRKGERMAYLQIDIDFFKQVNDTYGHATGDVILKKFAELLVETCRSFDIVSRNGGEEFSVILQDCPASHAVEVAERIRRTIETKEFQIKHKESIHITASIGVSAYPDYVKNPDLLIELADKALYLAKRSGRNKVVLYEDIISELG